MKKIVSIMSLVWVRHEEPGNYTHLILLPRNCLFTCPFWHWFQNLVSGKLHFFLANCQ